MPINLRNPDRALAMAVSVFNPELVVIGDLADAGDALLEPIRRAIMRDCMSAQAGALRVAPGALGDSAGVRGAAALVLADAPKRLAALLAGLSATVLISSRAGPGRSPL